MIEPITYPDPLGPAAHVIRCPSCTCDLWHVTYDEATDSHRHHCAQCGTACHIKRLSDLD